MKKSTLHIVFALFVLLLAASCVSPTAAPAIAPTVASTAVPAVASAGAPTVAPTAAPTVIPSNTAPAAPVITPTTGTVPPAGAGIPIFQYPAPPTGLPASLPPATPLGKAVAFAWNNLGMHCYQIDYSLFLILPPYNVFWTQVVSRGGEDPSIITNGLTVQYSVPQVTQPAAHTNFWEYAPAYGWNLQPGIGLTGNGTSGVMKAAGDHFIADGIPVVDVNDDGTWDPYPFFVATVKNSAGATIAETVNVAPASTEMSCYLCHTGTTVQESAANILAAHDKKSNTSLLSQAQGGKPVLCNSCHADAAMGVMANNGAQRGLSAAMHASHADKLIGNNLPANTCQACHPGPQTQCLRDAMAKQDITCTDCHGSMVDMGSPDRIAWVNLPTCESCHGQNLGKSTTLHIDNPNAHLTADETALYRNRKAHGGGGIYCAACHGSPHAIYPTLTERDNEQSIRLQGKAGFISQCSVCHGGTPDEPFWHTGGGD